MNVFENTFTEAKRFSKLLGHMHQAALEVNKTQEETRQDFLNSKRTGQCALSIQEGLIRIGAHYMNDNEEEKIRYTVVANNKVNFLLENPYRNDTFPLCEEERTRNELRKIFGGGIRVKRGLNNTLIAISGFHPKIDEASSIVIDNQTCSFQSEAARISYMMELSTYFRNPYALVIAQGSNWIKSMTFDQCLDWGKNEILKK